MNVLGSALGHKRGHLLAVNRATIPDHQQLLPQVMMQVFEEPYTVAACQRSALHPRGEIASRRDPTHHRQMIITRHRCKNRSLASRSVGANQAGQQIERCFINTYTDTTFFQRLFLSSGQTSVRQCSMASSSRWMALCRGSCGVQSNALSKRATCPRW
jgi:hypothetical protein